MAPGEVPYGQDSNGRTFYLLVTVAGIKPPLYEISCKITYHPESLFPISKKPDIFSRRIKIGTRTNGIHVEMKSFFVIQPLRINFTAVP